MVEAAVTVEQAGDALYTAYRVAQESATVLKADVGGNDFRSVFIGAFRIVTIHVAGADAPLSTDEINTIDHIFWLDKADTDAAAAAVIVHPDQVSDALGFLASMAQVINQADQLVAKPSDRTSNQLIVSAERVLQAALGSGSVEELGRARYTKVMAQLTQDLPKENIPAPAAAPTQSGTYPTEGAGEQITPAAGLQPVSCPARLHAGETCYATASAVLFQESNVLRSVRYRGLSGRVGIVRGVSYRSGSYKVDRSRTPKIERIADGTLCITDQRLIFLSDTKNLDLPFAKLLSCSTEPNIIEVTRPNAGRILFEYVDPSAVEVFEQITGTSAEHRQAVAAEPVEYDRPTMGYRVGHFLGRALVVAVGLILLLIYIVR